MHNLSVLVTIRKGEHFFANDMFEISACFDTLRRLDLAGNVSILIWETVQGYTSHEQISIEILYTLKSGEDSKTVYDREYKFVLPPEDFPIVKWNECAKYHLARVFRKTRELYDQRDDLD